MIYLSVYDGLPKTPSTPAEPWMAVLFLLTILVIGWIRINYPGRFERLFKSAFNVRMLHRVMREELVFSHRASMLLSVLFVLVSSLILYLAHKHFGWEVIVGQGLVLYLSYAALILLAFLTKSLVLMTIRSWADSDHGISEYMYNIYLYLKIAALLLLPISMFGAYAPHKYMTFVLMGAGFIMGALIVKRTIRGAIAALETGLSIPYILLYVCAFEIMPLLVFISLLVRR
jgi:hypothetical protein